MTAILIYGRLSFSGIFWYYLLAPLHKKPEELDSVPRKISICTWDREERETDTEMDGPGSRTSSWRHRERNGNSCQPNSFFFKDFFIDFRACAWKPVCELGGGGAEGEKALSRIPVERRAPRGAQSQDWEIATWAEIQSGCLPRGAAPAPQPRQRRL